MFVNWGLHVPAQLSQIQFVTLISNKAFSHFNHPSSRINSFVQLVITKVIENDASCLQQQNYLSLLSKETNTWTSFITFLPCIKLLLPPERFLPRCSASRTSSTHPWTSLSVLWAQALYLKSPFLCLLNAILIHRRASSDTFPFPWLVWSCQWPWAPVCIPILRDNVGSFLWHSAEQTNWWGKSVHRDSKNDVFCHGCQGLQCAH